MPNKPPVALTAYNVNKLDFAEAGQIHYRDDKLQGFGLRVGTQPRLTTLRSASMGGRSATR